MTEQELSTSLRFVSGGSNKDYFVCLGKVTGTWGVSFHFGRHGGPYTYGTKVIDTTYEKALSIYKKLVSEKVGKGYKQEGNDVTPGIVVTPSGEKKVSGLLPQLLCFIDESELNKYFLNNKFCMQEKKDGRRKIIRKVGDKVEAINRKGLVVGISETIINDVKKLSGNVTFDGEDCGEKYYVFDILSHNGKDVRDKTYKERYQLLISIEDELWQSVEILPTFITLHDKAQAFGDLEDNKAEGVVFKDIDAPYTAGRPNSGGPQVKWKWWADGTFEVISVKEGKRSVEVSALDKDTGELISMGNCTIPANYSIPKVGELVKVRYLYAYPNGGSLYQPQFEGQIDDKDLPDEYNTLKFKQGTIDEETEKEE